MNKENDVLEYLNNAFFIMNDRFKVKYPVFYLKIGEKLIKVLQSGRRFKEGYDVN